MAKKDIRITFFYADEAVWDFVKKNRTRDRLVTWANGFFDRYNFKIDEYPIPYNGDLYKKRFSLTKTNGIKADLTIFKQLSADLDTLFKDLDANRSQQIDVYFSTATDDEKRIKTEQLKVEWDKILAQINREIHDRSTPVDFELRFRKSIHIINTVVMPQKERLPIIFCEFKAQGGTYGLTREMDMPFGRFLWVLQGPPSIVTPKEIYTGPFILLDIKMMTKSREHSIAHEVVHAAGNTTLDNKGTPGNIMIYADAWNKAPTAVNLEATDKAKLESAFFVV